MSRFRRQAKLLGIFIVLGFLFAALELHAEHDEPGPQQEHHCGIQCCASHNLAPQKESATVITNSDEVHFISDTSLNIIFRMIPDSIFRPPIYAV